MSPASTIHLNLFTAFFARPSTNLSFINDGFILFVYLPPIVYPIHNLLIIGNELTDPSGDEK